MNRRRFLGVLTAAAVAPKAEHAASLLVPAPRPHLQTPLATTVAVFDIEDICRWFKVPVEIVFSEREIAAARAKKRGKAAGKKK